MNNDEQNCILYQISVVGNLIKFKNVRVVFLSGFL